MAQGSFVFRMEPGPAHHMPQEDISRKLILKLIYLICSTDIGGPLMSVQLDLQVIEYSWGMDMTLVIWIWSTHIPTHTKLLLTHTHTFLHIAYLYSC